MTSALVGRFARDVIAWQKIHGRHTLPWQNTRDPYRVWLSEIMLQQTQVGTVIDYYGKFLARFPTVAELAAAQEDDVLALWSGLGYYSRARNMHRCAQDVMTHYAGVFPKSAQLLQTLPGIGRSTAAAVAAFCFSERVAILDGNVKRVLTRVLAFSDDLASGKNEKQLWAIADALLPEKHLKQDIPRYTQGVMDLGATICTTRKPQCLLCPVQGICQGFAQGQPEKYPVKSKKLKRSSEHFSLLWAQKPDGSVWLERRPAFGVWGGLYCLPIFENHELLLAFLPTFSRSKTQLLPTFKHVLTHKDLHLSPVIAAFSRDQKMPLTNRLVTGDWFLPDAWMALGLPAPVRKLLEKELG